jgi:hypothetical protein
MSDAPRQSPSHAGGTTASRSAVGKATGGSRSLGAPGALFVTGRFLRRHLWLRPILAAVVVAFASWWVSRAVEDAMRQQRIDELTTILNADVAALEAWSRDQKSTADLLARDEKLVPMIQELMQLAKGDSEDMVRQLLQAKAQRDIRGRLHDPLKRWGYTGFIIGTPAGLILSADQDAPVGHQLPESRKEFRDRVFAGELAISRPFRSGYLLQDENGELHPNLPTMFSAAPIRDPQGNVIAFLGLRIRPEDQFTKILQVAQFGDTGETYAFDRNGLLLSQSRFDDDLRRIGLLADLSGSRSILTIEVRDPGVDMVGGGRPAQRRAEQPLTRMARTAIGGDPGTDADGYRDYRGVKVVGAWTWVEDYDMGVATEISVAEAFRPLYILRRVLLVLIALLVVAAIGIYIAMLFIARQQRALQKATLEARQLGQYTLEEKLGAGGMGTVYKARHAMLRRPTAVKLLDPDKMSDAAVARFEREVQMTSGLSHPNTVAIFDYGRTPEGIFYYAMEYLEGMNLEELVRRFWPLPEARVVHILRQVCGALSEAHAAGLVHRDVKPANIFLTCRGGLYDFVKVLDFGLVRAVDSAVAANITSANVVTGTPLYLSPEAVERPENVDARSDVYSIGGVGYFLLTGGPVFTGESVVEICMKHVQAVPEPPSVRCGRAISPALEALVLRCLAKFRPERPADAAELLRELERCPITGHWTPADAAAWWAERARQAEEAAAVPPAASRTPGIEATMEYKHE